MKKKLFRYTITARILTINIFAIIILVGGLLYLNQLRDNLISSKLIALEAEGKVIASALSESAINSKNKSKVIDVNSINPLLRRMTEPSLRRARVFDDQGNLVADSRSLFEAGRIVEYSSLSKEKNINFFLHISKKIINIINKLLYKKPNLKLYKEEKIQKAIDYPEVLLALEGKISSFKRIQNNTIILTVALPIQSFKQIQGALFLSTDTVDIYNQVRNFTLNILKISGITLLITILLSLYLAKAIAKPVKQLSKAAYKVGIAQNRKINLPDFTYREDEIGDLSLALKTMTKALYKKLDAIESFAADVSHEIKNPLSSLNSAIDTYTKTNNQSDKNKLIKIIKQDINRMNILITDISNFSRLDAELSRNQMKSFDILKLLETIILIYKSEIENINIKINSKLQNITIHGIQDALAQVFKNIIDNSISFSEKNCKIDISIKKKNNNLILTFDDYGPGVEELELNKIFDRFYTKRTNISKFGSHSGLGLSISKQIIEAHEGKIYVINRIDSYGKIEGLRITIKLKNLIF
ncbi:sensor histidine kinase [Alphaproteobacteria bacterium]|nr:sensor histidine kinase [Alphaproteobacteria bacterium]